MEKIKELVEILTNKNQTISTMESCTGGGFANAITNIYGASNIIKYSYITYSDEAKISLGINPDIINKYTVFSNEVATEMATLVAKKANSTYGIGITGQIDEDFRIIYIAIYNSINGSCENFEINIEEKLSRKDCKDIIISQVIDNLMQVI